MKLRIRGNSIRLRLMQAEVQQLEEKGFLEERIHFPNSQSLSYKLITSVSYEAVYEKGQITIRIPNAEAREWFSSENLSLRTILDNPHSGSLSLLVEKDLACLAPREGEDESDAFPNPEANG